MASYQKGSGPAAGNGFSDRKVNSHIHLPPNFSAFENVAQAVKLAAAERISILGVSNYYDFSVYENFATLAGANKIFPLFGLEIIAMLDDLAKAGQRINDPANPGKMYICGKGITRFDSPSPPAKKMLDLIRQNDRLRMAEMIEKLNVVIAMHCPTIKLIENEIIDMVAAHCGSLREAVTLQERHLSQALQDAIFKAIPAQKYAEKLAKILDAVPQNANDAAAVQNDIRTHLLKIGKPAFVAEKFISFPQAYELILQLGGIPCYPILADGAKPICEFETPVEKLIDELIARNIHCVELIPIRNKSEILRQYVTKFCAANFVIVAGTEHNTLDMLPMEPKCLGGTEIDEDIKQIFQQGAYVIAAHQDFSVANKTGFVDNRGNLNSAYPNAKNRIEEFAKIGCDIIRKYLFKTDGVAK